MDNGSPDNPSLEKYRIYKIRSGWQSLAPGSERDAYQKDWDNWPVDDGTPWKDVNELF